MTDDTRPEPATDRRRSLDPDPRPTLTPRWYLVLVFSNGATHELLVADQADGEWKGSRLRRATWRIEKELVGPRSVVGPVRRNRIVTEELDRGPGTNGRRRPD